MKTAVASVRLSGWFGPCALAAACAPSLLAFNLPPSSTFLNQALAFGLWGLLAMVSGLSLRLDADQRRVARLGLVLPGLLLALLALAALASHLIGTWPRSLALSALATLAAAAVLLVAGAQAGATVPALSRQVLGWICVAWLGAGVLSAIICLVQVLAPHWADGVWIARGSLAGRGIGNLRQPNHVCTLLLWSAIAALALVELRWVTARAAAALLLVLAAGLVCTASRTALLGAVMMALWGLADRRLSRHARKLLLLMPVLLALCWAALSAWAALAHTTLALQQRLAEPDLSSSRTRIWSDSLELIQKHPWTGVGFGEFNFAWSLSELPHRPVAFFDHAHNLFIHWAVELGLPLAAGLSLLLLAMGLRLLQAVRHAPRDEPPLPASLRVPDASLGLRVALAWLALILLHSQLEYPLWYAYFLLPTAWILGFGLAQAGSLRRRQNPAARILPEREVRRRRLPRQQAPALSLAGLLCLLGAAGALLDYRQVAVIYDGQSHVSLQERLTRGLQSPLFAHQAAYAAGTVAAEPEREMDALRQAAHNLLDTRLMIAWARAYAGSGDSPRAQYLVARLREFRNPAAADFFRPCAQATAGKTGAAAAAETAASADKRPSVGNPEGSGHDGRRSTSRADTTLPFQCQVADPRVVLRWTHFR